VFIAHVKPCLRRGFLLLWHYIIFAILRILVRSLEAQINEENRMKRKLALWALAFLVTSFVNSAFAEPYINKTFPPDEILKKAAQDLAPYKVGLDDIDIVGNFKADDNRYVVYFNVYHIGKKEITRFNLIKLNTDIWIIGNQQSEEKILQK
jgi:hypothetical protein